MRDDSILAPAWKDRAGSPPAVEAGARLALGIDRIDADLLGGLRSDGLHEFYAARIEDGASTLGFGLALARRRQAQDGRPLLWGRLARGPMAQALPYGPGLVEWGLEPARMAVLLLPDARSLLRAGLDAIRAGAAGALLLEMEGPCPLLDLTASRRMALAAAETGTMVLLVRRGAQPVPSAAHSRWEVAAAPSDMLEAGAPGAPAFALTLQRQRGGRDGMRYHLCWDRESGLFHEQREEGSALFPATRTSLDPRIATPRVANDRWGAG